MGLLDSVSGWGIGGVVYGWLNSVIFWIIVTVAIGIGLMGGLYLRKRRKFNKPVLEIYDVGSIRYLKDGTIDFERSSAIFDFVLTKGGWFKHRFTFLKLWDYGNENLFRLKDMTPVYDVSHNDYRKINGVNGLVVIRNPDDQKFAIPISKFFISQKSKSAMAEIAPVDLRNAAQNSIEQVDAEMRTKWEKIMPILMAGFIGLILIFSILLIAQYGKHNVEVTSETLKYAADKLAAIGNAASTSASTIAP